jgi:hypothetical protein
LTGFFEDHGLPLVQLKNNVAIWSVSPVGQRSGPVSKAQIADIAAIQHAIAAVEAVIVDLDAETYTVFSGRQLRQVFRLEIFAALARSPRARPSPRRSARRSTFMACCRPMSTLDEQVSHRHQAQRGPDSG